jgi:hypothetical protein
MVIGFQLHEITKTCSQCENDFVDLFLVERIFIGLAPS